MAWNLFRGEQKSFSSLLRETTVKKCTTNDANVRITDEHDRDETNKKAFQSPRSALESSLKSRFLYGCDWLGVNCV
jgi:hypothetical protein